MRHGHYSDLPAEGFNWQVIKVIWPYMLEFKRRVGLAVLCLVAAKLATIAGPFLLKHIVDSLEVQNPVLFLPAALVMAYGLARFSSVLFGEIRDTLFGHITERAMRRISLQVFQHMHALDLGFHLGRRTGGLARDIERGITGIGFLMRFFIFNIAPTLFEILMVAGLLFYHYGPSFALITLVSVTLYVTYSVITTEWRTRFVREQHQADSATNTRAVDSLLNYETVKYFGNEQYEADCYDVELAQWEQARRKSRLSMFALNGGQALIIAAAMTAMMFLAVYRIYHDTMTIGDFVLINAFMLQLFLPLNFLGFIYREIKGSLTSIEQMFALLDIKPAINDADDATELNTEIAAIAFDNVSFHYQPDRAILKHISFHISPGEKLAVVGASGAGKSTLVKLLFRFYDPVDGYISIDGQDIKSVSIQSLRRAIGIVPQDTVLFNASIIDNIRYGKPDANDAEIQHAIELAHLKDFIEQLPQGGNTVVGERGLKLSGGEKQRVAIARTILKKPPILVFDEATSSLDSKSERAILDAIRDISSGHTSLVIAHRLSTIVDADRILVMENGDIIEQGNHQSLLANNQRYAEMWALQQKRGDSDMVQAS